MASGLVKQRSSTVDWSVSTFTVSFKVLLFTVVGTLIPQPETLDPRP